MTMLSWAGLRKDHGAPEMFYSPGQPRGADGRFINASGGSSSGGSSSGGSKAKTKTATAEPAYKSPGYKDPKVPTLIDEYGAKEVKAVATPAAEAAAKSVYADAVAREPKLSATVREVGEAAGGKLERFDFRLKGEGSIARKIETAVIEAREDQGIEMSYDDASATIKDAVRYTVVAPEDSYWQTGDAVKAQLEAKGWTENGKQAGGWLEMYRGRNLKMKDETGYPVEVQIHTDASLLAAEKAHNIYNVARLPTTPEPVVDQLNAETRYIFDSLPVPTDLPNKDDFANTPGAKNRNGSTTDMDGVDPRSATNAQRLAQAKIMYSKGSKQYAAAMKRWG